ncbi:PhnD/SsuA/transferrin family substrate-binding protein [Gracilibacillus oryzae]|uniref:PhnD/SsuA/transferrin family substrate-binding protein n=1 Tax=Gracilibacillus oryzae TaxID=1672701 RepID=A0A7C8GTR5_9BACI|nr:phosphate/phosphite/phosphonate ABC transporter substrate-binding protein [Gracilibacillus oryzae]KAB8137800.1 PhnD/SsuA/transferrin family substrate-binding protein [Gracilibacillus oryzae]
MKKLWLLLIAVLFATVLAACGNAEEGSANEGNDTEAETTETETNSSASEEEPAEEAANKAIDTLSIDFVPSREPDEIITATEPLKELLKTEMANLGYDIGTVEINVGTSYEAVGEGLVAGTTDIGLIPGGTYVLYDDGAEVILTATRAGLNNDSDNAKDWNENKPTEPSDEQVTYYRALMIAGPSAKGQELAEKVNNGEELTFEDVNSANWAVMSTSSPAGYIYPAIWLQNNFEKTISDLDNAVQVDSYGSAFARMAQEQIDVMVTYADARRDNAEAWQGEFGREGTIWDETNVIGVTPGIYNDTISVSKNSEKMTDDVKAAIQQAFINIAETDEGKEVISIYNHEGYQKAESSDYDNERKAQEMVQNMK